MAGFLVSSSRERARFRHFALQKQAVKEEIAEFLKKKPGVIGLKTGYASILIFMDENAHLPEICADLCTKFPILQTKEGSGCTSSAQNAKKNFFFQKKASEGAFNSRTDHSYSCSYRAT